MDREQRRLNQLHQYSNHGQCGQEILASSSSMISSSAMEHHEDIGNESQAEEEHHTKYKSQPTKKSNTMTADKIKEHERQIYLF